MTFETNLDRNEGVQQFVLENIQSGGREINEDAGMGQMFRVILWQQGSLDDFKC